MRFQKCEKLIGKSGDLIQKHVVIVINCARNAGAAK